MVSKRTMKRVAQYDWANLCLSLGLRLVMYGIGRADQQPEVAGKDARRKQSGSPYGTTGRTNTGTGLCVPTAP